MLTVCIESPLAGEFERNIAYARAALRYCLERGVSPYASHLLFPQVWNDLDAAQREAGIEAGLVMGNLSDQRWFFVDVTDGVFTKGMRKAANQAPASQAMQTKVLGSDWRERYKATPTPGF